MGTLYQLTSPSGKSYIGISSKTTELRWNKHVEHALGKRDNGALYSALRKYGTDNFQVKTLVISDNWDYLCDLECKAIISFKTKSPNGYNITDGGEGTVGRVISDKERENISLGQKKRFERPDEKEKLRSYGEKARHNMKEKWKALRIDGMAAWERRVYEKRLHFGTPEHSEMVSRTTKEAMARPEVKEKMIAIAKARAANPEWRKKVSEAKKGQGLGCKRSEEHVQKQVAGIYSAWSDPIKKAARLEKNRITRELKNKHD